MVADNNIIVGSSSTLYRLTPDLVEVESMPLPDSRANRLLVADRTRDGLFVLACGPRRCFLSPNDNLADILWRGVVLQPAPEDPNVLGGISLTNNGSLSVTYGTTQSPDRPSAITRGSLLNSFRPPPYTYSEYAEQSEENTSVMREFLIVFTNAGYQFFVASVNNETHITRLCLSDIGDQPSPDGSFASYFELELKCAGSESATAAMFVNSTEPFGVETVLLAFQADGVYICAFNLSEINEQMDQKFETCINESGNAGLRRDLAIPCQRSRMVGSILV